MFKGYTVDERLREFRRVSWKQGEPSIEFVPFDSQKGEKLFRKLTGEHITPAFVSSERMMEEERKGHFTFYGKHGQRWQIEGKDRGDAWYQMGLQHPDIPVLEIERVVKDDRKVR